MHWKTKAALFRAFDMMPFGSHIHYWAQRNVTKTWPRPDEDLAALVGIARRNIQDFERHSTKPIDQASFFEIGAGRDLIVPIAMRLLGVKLVATTDIERLARLDLVNAAAQTIGRLLDRPAPHFATWDELDRFGVIYRAPFDAATDTIPVPADAFVSNEVLEHIPRDVLVDIFKNIIPQLREKITIHSVDYSDHFARGGGVSRYNFLQFSDREWAKFNPRMHFVNRLRHSEYLAIMREAGLHIAHEEPYAEELPSDLKIDREFEGFCAEDLKIMRARTIATADQ